MAAGQVLEAVDKCGVHRSAASPRQRLAEIVADCLKPDPIARPKLSDVRDRLHDALAVRSSLAAGQVALFLGTAEAQTSADEWAYIEKRIASLRHAIETKFPEPCSP